METLLIFGRTGQVARALQRYAPNAHFADRDEADLTNPDACADLIRHLRPSAVINAAAYTAVDKAESDAETAKVVNTSAPAAMAATCAELGIPFVHVSTEYVFDGSGGEARAESAATNPLSVYGATKRKGEQAVLNAHPRAVVVRTSWVFSEDGGNFVKTMLRLGAERSRLTIVADQIGGPTPAADIAAALLQITEAMLDDPQRSGGIYHFAGTPDSSWADFARAIFTRSGMDVEVVDIPSTDYPSPAHRPLNSRLDCTAIGRDYGISRPDWRTGLDKVLSELERNA